MWGGHALTLVWSRNISRCTTGSFNSVYALHTSLRQMNSSNLSERPGTERCLKKKKSFDIYLYGHKEKLFIFLIMFTPAKKLIMTLCLLEAVELRAMYEKSYAVRGWPFDCWVVIWGMGDLRKKYPTDWFWGKKKYSKEIPGLKKISLVGYNPVKNLTLLYSAWQGKKNYISRGLGNKKSYPNHNPPPPPPLKRQMFDP